jgi:steroid delta-isomerase-like uncharacterized protein
MMSAQQNKQLARTIYDLFSNNKVDQALEHAVEDVEVVFTPTGQTFRGRDEFSQFMKGFKTAFPDIVLEVTSQVATEDQVVSEFVAKGHHTGPLLTPVGDIPATGRYAEWQVCEVWRVRDGKLAQICNYQDAATLMRQLGLLPEPDAAEA